jgi:hypothetical protein
VKKKLLTNTVFVCYAENMKNLLPASVSLKGGLLILGVVLALVGGVVFLYFSRQQIDRWWHILFLKNAVSSQNSLPANADGSEAVTVSAIEPLLAPCRFTFRAACITPISPNQGDQETQPKKTPKYEDFALDDVFLWFDNHTQTNLSTKEVVLTADQVAVYFPEYARDVSNNTLNQSVALTLTRIASKYNINPRLLLALMELQRQNNSPLVSPTADINKPFFDSADGFVAQVERVARELHQSNVKYQGFVRAKLPLPTEIQFFNKTYQIKKNVTPEDLAVVEFIGQYAASRQDFEKAIKVFAPEQKPSLSRTIIRSNFSELYFELYQLDPLILP